MKKGWRDAIPFVVGECLEALERRQGIVLHKKCDHFLQLMKSTRFVLEDYMHFLQVERQLSGNTLVSYRRDLEEYLDFVEQRQFKTMNEVDRIAIVEHLRRLQESGKSARTVSRHISSIRSFHQFLLREKVTTQDPTVHLELPKLEQKLPRVLSMDEIDRLIASPDRKSVV